MQVVIHAGVAFSDNDRLIETLMANTAVLSQQRVIPLDLAQGRQFVKVASDSITTGVPLPEVLIGLNEVLPDRNTCDRVVLSSEALKMVGAGE